MEIVSLATSVDYVLGPEKYSESVGDKKWAWEQPCLLSI